MTRAFINHAGIEVIDNTDTFQSARFGDTCGCHIITDNNFIFKDWIHKCKLHFPLPNNQGLWNAVLAHHQAFNLKHGRNPTEAQLADLRKDKETERKRIEKLP